MKLIGAGFPRTGTHSTKVALEQLGFGPCYHFSTLFERPQDVDIWQMAAERKAMDWETLFVDFHSAVDWPVSLFYKELMEVYPNAKVLLNIRDSEAWYESVLQTVYVARGMTLAMPEDAMFARAGRMLDTLAWQGLLHGRFEDKPYAISVFEQCNQDVKDFVPADRLLVWNVKEGWEPLCSFLGVAMPNTPFPRVNDAEEFRQRLSEAH